MEDRLQKFREAQTFAYSQALQEIRNGRKTGHWIWFIFPQMRGLGHSYMSDYFGIEDMKMARAYLADPLLGARLIEITSALLELEENNIHEIMGYPDDLKLCSSMTLFARAGGAPCFQAVLDRYYQGREDTKTLALLAKNQC